MPRIFYRAYAYPPLIFQWFIRLFVLFVFKVFTRLEVHGLDNLAFHKGPLIFASNHASEWDSLLIRSVLPMFSRFGPMFAVSREKSFYSERFGWRAPFYGGFLFKMVGAFPVTVGQRNYGIALKNHLEILRDGGNVVIFPEGGVSKTGELKAGKGGVIYLSVKSGAPIIPIGISGLYNLSSESLFKKRRKVVVNFGSPYIPNIISRNEDEFVTECKSDAKDLVGKISNLVGVTQSH